VAAARGDGPDGGDEPPVDLHRHQHGRDIVRDATGAATGAVRGRTRSEAA